MVEFFGVILIDTTEVLLRIYQIDEKHWKLLYHDSKDLIDKKLEKNVNQYDIAEIVAAFFLNASAQRVAEWRICAREMSKQRTAEIALALGQRIEHLDRQREQELISKGLFTELW